MAHKYIVNLTEEEREGLRKLVTSGRTAARTLTRARILLKTASGAKDETIAQALDVAPATIYRIRQRCVEEGVEAAITARRPRRDYRRKLDGDQEAHLIALNVVVESKLGNRAPGDVDQDFVAAVRITIDEQGAAGNLLAAALDKVPAETRPEFASALDAIGLARDRVDAALEAAGVSISRD